MKETKIDYEHIVRYHPSFHKGLNRKEVALQKEAGLQNYEAEVKTKTIPQIISGHVFTLFNFLNFFLGIAVLLTGTYKNLLFLGVVLCNILIGVIQEIRSKKVIDRLSVIATPQITVMRDSMEEQVTLTELVLDDVIALRAGSQVVIDAVILDGVVEVNESFITGESDTILKKKGDLLLSGSFIVSGKTYAKVEHLGTDNYAYQISKDAKYIKKINSQLLNSLNKVIKMISFLIVPLGALLFVKQMSIPENTISLATINTVAAIIGMIPEGLILLTSTVLAVSVIRLSKYSVLVQELYCIETLARVDALCLDKTGTITTGEMEVYATNPIHGSNIKEVGEVLCGIASISEDNNATMKALKQKYCGKSDWKLKSNIAFSSSRKWASYTFEKGTYVIGAPEFILKDLKYVDPYIKRYAKEYRLLLLAKVDGLIVNECLPEKVTEMAVILLRDSVREEANEVLKYFREQGVALKIISGDHIDTVLNIAERAGMKGKNNAIDATQLITYEQVKEAVLKYDIFGRVTPNQKKQIVLALKELDYTVGMTGDGVNDVLALKEADCSIALASGSDASKNVSQLVLLDSNFSSLPKVLLEGRRTINNIERSASLFLVKTLYATLLAFLFLFLPAQYPFIPIQLTLISMSTIGIPSFILALEPNQEKVKGYFLTNVIGKAIPGALTIVINILLIVLVGSLFHFSQEQISTLTVLATSYIAFLYLYQVCKPFNTIRKVLYGGLLTFYLLQVFFIPKLYSLVVLPFIGYIWLLVFILLSIAIFHTLTIILKKFIIRHEKIFHS